VIVKYNSKLC